jgi:hypothetical protein
VNAIATTPSSPSRRVTDQPDAAPFPSGDRGRYPEEDEDYPRPFARAYGDDYAQGRTGPLSNEYRVEMGRWFSIAQAHFSGKVLLAALYVLIVIVITASLDYVGGLASSVIPYTDRAMNFLVTGFIGGPLSAGLVLVALRQLKGESWTFGDFFGGFHKDHYLSLVGFCFIQELLTQVPMIPGFVLLEIGNKQQDPNLIFGAAGVMLLALPVIIFVSVRLLMFGQQLILDRRYGAVDALKGNWELTDGHFGMLFVVELVLGLIMVAGILACFIGYLFALPFTVLVTTAGYLLIAGTRPPLERPDAYGSYRAYDRVIDEDRGPYGQREVDSDDRYR